jgi:hypothetical protein
MKLGIHEMCTAIRSMVPISQLRGRVDDHPAFNVGALKIRLGFRSKRHNPLSPVPERILLSISAPMMQKCRSYAANRTTAQ